MQLSQRTFERSNYDKFADWLSELGFSSNEEINVKNESGKRFDVDSWIRIDSFHEHLPGKKAKVEAHKFEPVHTDLGATFELRIVEVSDL